MHQTPQPPLDDAVDTPVEDPVTASEPTEDGRVSTPVPEAAVEPVEPVEQPQYVSPLLGLPVLVLGLGASGLAMARWCMREGAHVVVADTREQPPALDTLRAELPQVEFISGPMDAGLLQRSQARMVFKSPGLAPAPLQALHAAALAAAIPWTGELGLFAQALHALRLQRSYQPRVLAVTGTNGKTTVCSLSAQLVERAGKTVALAGNIGPTLLDTLQHHLATDDDLPEVWVLELSSFQLADMAATPTLGADWRLEPTAATVLNITEDHLDWHGDLASYTRAKAAIFGQQGLMVLNRDDAAVMAMLPPPPKGRGAVQRPWLSFGAGVPARPADFGLETVNGIAWLAKAAERDPTWKPRKGQEEDIHLQRLMPAEALRIRGRHNAVNALAALALVSAAGCTLAPVLFGLREYRGEPHRVMPLGLVRDVEFFDDSKGTNVGATVAALQGLGAERRMVVILGGDGKGQDFSPLAAPVAQFARAAVLIGRDAPRIREALQGCGVPLLQAEDMDEAVRLGFEQAHPGDAVLLSPACASLDMYRNYVHRAEVFAGAVSALALDLGTVLEGES